MVPLAVVVVIVDRDWIPALIIAGTLPLIPIFMALVGAATRDRMELQLRTLQQLAGHFLDVVAGLPTLKVFGRAKAQIRAIAEVTDRYRRAAMSTLRITFLSSLILELVATISVALVAVAVGLQLLGGDVGLRTALVVLVLAPEAYLPLRLLGANYHASSEGLSAAEQVFSVLETQTGGIRRRAWGHARGDPRDPRSDPFGDLGPRAHGRLSGPREPGARPHFADDRARGGGGAHGSERVWQVDAARRAAGVDRARRGHRNRRRRGVR